MSKRTTTSSSSSRSSIKPYDLEASLNRLGGDVSLFEALARFFCEDGPQLLSKVCEGIDGEDCETVERSAHSLKGLASNFGASAAVLAAQHMESLGTAGDLNGAKRALPPLEAEVQRLKLALEEALKESSSS
jgi:two-component system sensor histidine kinase/response regulator